MRLRMPISVITRIIWQNYLEESSCRIKVRVSLKLIMPTGLDEVHMWNSNGTSILPMISSAVTIKGGFCQKFKSGMSSSYTMSPGVRSGCLLSSPDAVEFNLNYGPHAAIHRRRSRRWCLVNNSAFSLVPAITLLAYIAFHRTLTVAASRSVDSESQEKMIDSSFDGFWCLFCYFSRRLF